MVYWHSTHTPPHSGLWWSWKVTDHKWYQEAIFIFVDYYTKLLMQRALSKKCSHIQCNLRRWFQGDYWSCVADSSCACLLIILVSWFLFSFF